MKLRETLGRLPYGGVPAWARDTFYALPFRERWSITRAARRQALRSPRAWLAFGAVAVVFVAALVVINVFSPLTRIQLGLLLVGVFVLTLLATVTIHTDAQANLYRILSDRFPHLCKSCGYDMRASGDVCPECGAVQANSAGDA